ncbi:hypothetical protein F4861DRAFT_498844 [Xylaria intraflava]|nr:hypothetical protein F4861DRAFT_498844 [Xylaria intraflava]
MKVYCAAGILLAAVTLAQNFNSGTQTITVSGSTITVGGTNAATITVGSNTITVGGATTTSDDAADSTADADADADSGDSADDADADADDNEDGEEDDADTTAAPDSDGATISGYTHTPTTLTYGSSKIVLGPSAAEADSNSAAAASVTVSYAGNATMTTHAPEAPSSEGDNGGASPTVPATATPQGPTSSLDAAPTDASPPHSGAAIIRSAGGLLALMGAGLAYIL